MLSQEKKKSAAKQVTALGLVLCGAVVFALGAWSKLSAPANAANAEVVAGYTILRGAMDRAQGKAACEAAGLVLASLDSLAARDQIDAARGGAEHFWLDGVRDGGGALAWESGKAFDGSLAKANAIRDEQGQDCGAFYMNGAGVHNGFESMVCAEVHDGALCEGGSFLAPPDCQAADLDVVFVIDASGSIGSAGFQSELDWSSSVVAALVKETDRVSFVRFAGSGSLLVSLSLADSVGKTTAERQLVVENIAYTKGGTYTAEALDRALAEFDNASRSQILFLLTDGKPTSGHEVCPTRADGFSYKADMDSRGIELILVGIGAFDATSVQCLAEDSETFLVTSLDTDEAEALLNDVFGAIKC